MTPAVSPRLLARRLSVLLLLALLFSPHSAGQASPAAPPTVVVDLLDYRANATAGTWISTVNVSFEIPPEFDPAWSFVLNGSPDESLCQPSYCYFDNTYSEVQISERPGWAWLIISTVAGNEQTDAVTLLPTQPVAKWGFRNVTLSAINGTVRGTPSCTIPMHFSRLDLGMYLGPTGGTPGFDDGTFNTLTHKIPNEAGQPSYFACGTNATLEPPPGVSAVVNSTYAAGGGTSDINITWRSIRSDPSFSLDYYVMRHYNNPPAKQSTLFWQLDSDSDGLDTPQLHSKIMVGSGVNGTTDPVWFRVLARDPLTHQQSLESCIIQTLQGQNNSASTCGTLTFTTGGGTIAAQPIFPGLDVDLWYEAMGFNSIVGGLVLSVVVIGLMSFFGYMLTNAAGGVVAAVLGIGITTIWGLLSPWILFVGVAILITIIVLRWNQGGSA